MLPALPAAGLVLPCVLALLAPASGCGGGTPPPAHAPAAPASFAGSFSADAAWGHLEAQIAMGPRAHGTDGWRAIHQYLREHLATRGAHVAEMTFEHQGLHDAAPTEFLNIVGIFEGTSPEWVLIGTHYDTRSWADEDPDPARHAHPIDGANDGGSGTAVMLAIADVLAQKKPPIGVALVFFDGEDYGRRREWQDYFLGSRALASRWSEIFGASRPRCAVVLDMVADRDLAFRREAVSAERFPALVEHVWSVGRAVAPDAFSKPGGQAVTDDHVPLMGIGIPATLLIDFEYPQWHTAADTLSQCSAESLGVTGRVVLGSLLDTPLPKGLADGR